MLRRHPDNLLLQIAGGTPPAKRLPGLLYEVHVMEGAKVGCVCKTCGASFLEYRSNLRRHKGSGRYCSRQCANEGRRTSIQVNVRCQCCGRPFVTTESRVSSGRGKCCSRACENKRRGDSMSGGRNPNWKGGEWLSSSGYRACNVGHGEYERQHRIVAETILGRELLHGEVVHHVNGDKADNRAENLQVMSSAEHVRLHAIIRHRKRQADESSERREAVV